MKKIFKRHAQSITIWIERIPTLFLHISMTDIDQRHMVLKETKMWMSVFCDITMSTMIILLIQSWTKQSGKFKGTFFVRGFISSVKNLQIPTPHPAIRKKKPQIYVVCPQMPGWYIMQYLSRHNNQHKEVSRVSALLGFCSR